MSGAPVFTTAAIRAVEEAAAKGLVGATLMQRAGKAAADAAMALAKDTGGAILVVAGPGNNGGDAWVAASHLRADFHRVSVLDVAGSIPKAPEARGAKARFLELGGVVLREWPKEVRPALVVDGLFGIGLARELDAAMRALVARINTAGAPVLALDIPSGLASDSGRILGDAVHATRTLTFLARKLGLHTADGLDCCGEIQVDDLGVDPRLLADAKGELLTPDVVRGWLPARARNSHKGQFGTLGILGGARGMVGAALLAARAGLHAGAGKVYVGLLADDAPAVDLVHPELMLRPVEDVMRADVLVLGPGAGFVGDAKSPSTFERTHLPAAMALDRPLVFDADALNAIAANELLERKLVQDRKAATILTPHPAEAARLLKLSTAQVQADRLAAALALAERLRSFVVLKGAGSICASPSGSWCVNATGNPGLASGGTGDVLAGLIGALICQGLDAWQALRYGVCLHGAAADACVAHGIGPAGLTASEVALQARHLLNQWSHEMGSDSMGEMGSDSI